MKFTLPLCAIVALSAIAATAAGAAGTPPLHKTGALIIPEGKMADLDTGRLKEVGADIWFAATSASNRTLAPRSGAKIGWLGKVRPDYRRCQRAARSTSPIKMSVLFKGSFVCVKTALGRVGYVEVVSPAGASPGHLGLRYKMWGAEKVCCRLERWYRLSSEKDCRTARGTVVPMNYCSR